MFLGKLPKFCTEKFGKNVTKAIKRIRPENFSLKGCRRGGGGYCPKFFLRLKCPSSTPYWSGKTSSHPPAVIPKFQPCKEYIPSLAVVLNYKCNQVHPLPIAKRIQARCLIDLTKSYTQDFL